MPTEPKSLPSSPLVRVLEQEIIPQIKTQGMQSIIVARSTLHEMQERTAQLPPGAYLTSKPLLSKKVPVRQRLKDEKSAAFVNARWPKDRLHASTSPVLGFVIEGEVAMPFGDYVLHCKSGQGFLILPGTPYSDGTHLCLEENAPENAHCSMFSIRAWRQGVACWLNHTREGMHWCDVAQGEYYHMLNPQIRHYLETLSAEVINQAPQYREIGEGIFQAMMFMLWRELQQMRYLLPNQGNTGPEDEAPLSEDESIRRAQEYIHHNLHMPLNINIVAGQVYMSRAHFTRQFRKITGTTFNDYLKQYRLTNAKMLLENTQYPIKDVSKVVGISMNHLRVLFLQNLGLTPQEYRRQNRRKDTSGQCIHFVDFQSTLSD